MSLSASSMVMTQAFWTDSQTDTANLERCGSHNRGTLVPTVPEEQVISQNFSSINNKSGRWMFQSGHGGTCLNYKYRTCDNDNYGKLVWEVPKL